MDGWMDEWMDEWMDGWMDGWMELSLLRLVQSFFGLLGRLSNCCPLSSCFSEKNWSHVPLILLGCVGQLAVLMLFCSPSCAWKSIQNEVQNV